MSHQRDGFRGELPVAHACVVNGAEIDQPKPEVVGSQRQIDGPSEGRHRQESVSLLCPDQPSAVLTKPDVSIDRIGLRALDLLDEPFGRLRGCRTAKTKTQQQYRGKLPRIQQTMPTPGAVAQAGSTVSMGHIHRDIHKTFQLICL